MMRRNCPFFATDVVFKRNLPPVAIHKTSTECLLVPDLFFGRFFARANELLSIQAIFSPIKSSPPVLSIHSSMVVDIAIRPTGRIAEILNRRNSMPPCFSSVRKLLERGGRGIRPCKRSRMCSGYQSKSLSNSNQLLPARTRKMRST